VNDVAELRGHLIADHPGADAPWWTGSEYLDSMRADALERLHTELHRQGEEHVDRRRGVEFIEVRSPVCRRSGCARPSPRADGLCDLHGDEQDRLRGRRSA
jgi:hypothetical protein